MDEEKMTLALAAEQARRQAAFERDVMRQYNQLIDKQYEARRTASDRYVDLLRANLNRRAPRH